MWKNPFKKTAPLPPSRSQGAVTFKERVSAFWDWYAVVAPDIYVKIENRKNDDLAPLVSPKVDEWVPGFGWVFGPGADGVGHSFTLTPEGDPFKRLLAHYWLDQASVLDGWTFYASRQAERPFRPGQTIRIAEQEFGAEEIWVTPWVDEQEEDIDITVWHPLFEKIESSLRHTVTFLWLDEVLGEEGTANWIGEIKLGDHQLAGAMPLSELPEFIEDLKEHQGWMKFPPHQTFSSYRCKEPERGQLRSDIIAGSTCLTQLALHYPLENNPLAELGVDLLMIVLPAELFPQGRQVEVRGELEDALTKVFEAEKSGRVVGGAIGLDHVYIDVLFYDGPRSFQQANAVLGSKGFGDTALFVSFVEAPA